MGANQQDSFSDKELSKAIEVFKSSCLPLGSSYWNDVVSVTVDSFDEYAPFRMELGWQHTIHLAIKLSEDPVVMPKFDNNIGTIAGQTLHYDLGSGLKTGFFSTKRISQLMCGIPVDDAGSDVFKEDPAFSFLNK